MLKFLHKVDVGIGFIIINSRQTGADFRALQQMVRNSAIKVYQETSDEPIWNIIEGGTDDMFIYDKCGRLNYYVPHPLSAIHDKKPIVPATLMSSYFDNPCGCQESDFTPKPSDGKETSQSAAMVTTPVNNISNETEIIILDESETTVKTTVETKYDPYANSSILETNLDPTKNRSTSENFTKNEDKGDGIDYNTMIIPINLPQTSSPVSQEQMDQFSLWKIWQFFFGEAGSSNSKKDAEKFAFDSSRGNESMKNSASWLMEKRCNGFNKSVCVEISVGRLLRARLCCLKESGQQQSLSRGFGCSGHTKSICGKMLPLIKCCLKDFDQVLDSYLNNTQSAYVG
ncbi:uncharacterized protein LOC141855856 [Brevipalpus obovatus]|uniref:uncharacterized protein LOC141855856 n=1 Tax=Brevipalpus obovatus TaxID=246614 RepID=UPI003D9E0187